MVSYFSEISLMMFGFGDSQEPNPETVCLVESITQEQLRLIIEEALKYQKDDVLNGEEFVFLLRKNKFKMRRFVKYLINKEQCKRAKSNAPPTQDLPKCNLIEFIEHIDETGELMNISEFDDVKYERMVRADRISVALNEENYIKFAKARRTSFMRKNMSQINNLKKLKMWLDPKNEVNLTNVALEVLAYLTYDTVAQLTDYALLVRMDSNRTSDPLGNLQGQYFSASIFNGDHRLGGANPDYSKVHSGNPPISVGEVREVMRRVYSPQVGKLNFGRKLPNTHHILAL